MFLLDCLVYSRSKVSGLESVNKMSVGSPLSAHNLTRAMDESSLKATGLTSMSLETFFSKRIKLLKTRAHWYY